MSAIKLIPFQRTSLHYVLHFHLLTIRIKVITLQFHPEMLLEWHKVASYVRNWIMHELHCYDDISGLSNLQ